MNLEPHSPTDWLTDCLTHSLTDSLKYENETLQNVEEQTYLGIEMTSSGRYTCTREILSKKAIKVLSIVNRSFSNTETATIAIKNKLFVSPVTKT